MKVTRLLHDRLIEQGGSASRNRIALIAEGRSYRFGELLEAAQRLGGALYERGVVRGERVAIYLDNGWACAVAIYATLIAGGAFVLINPQTQAEKLQYILRDSGARVLISDSRLAAVYREAIQGLTSRPAVISRGTPEGDPDGFERLIAAAEPLATPAPVIPLDLAAILYTSGSTGEPKGVMQTHQSMVFTAGSLIEYLRLKEDEKILCVMPLSFDYGLYQLLMSVTLGACLVLERSFTFPGLIFERIRTEDVSVFPGVPTIFATLLAAHERSPLRFPSVTRLTNTAAALPDHFVTGLREIFPNALLYKMYGLTECKRVSYLEPELVDSKPGSVGRAIPGTEVFLLSTDGKPVLPRQTGTLYVRGPHVMAGYWNRPDLTEHMLKPGKLPGERVLCTHDLFQMDEDGFLYFIGRTDDIIKSRGEKISPVEVENALHRIPGIREAAVIGTADPLLGEAVCAYVVADSASRLTPQAVRTGCASHLEAHMIPKRIIFCEHLPRSPNGKIDKRRLQEAPPADHASDGHVFARREADHD